MVRTPNQYRNRRLKEAVTRCVKHIAVLSILSISAIAEAQPSNFQLDEASAILGAPTTTPSDRVREATGKIRTVVFISSSIPVEKLARLFLSASQRSQDTIFLFRGWIPPQIAGVVAHAARAAKLAKELDPAATIDPNILIDPQPFEQYNVQVAPSTLTRCSDGGWRMSIGELGLSAAEFSACTQPRQIVGATFPIIEPNILNVIAERADRVDWDAMQRATGERANSASFVTGVPLPPATSAQSTLHDPSVIISQDIVRPVSLDGREKSVVVARKGQRLNPLDTMAIKPIIVWNPMRRSERATVIAWLQRHPDSYVFVTQIAMADGTNATDAISQPVYPLTTDIAKRSGVTHTPTLVVQDRNLLRLTREVSIDP